MLAPDRAARLLRGSFGKSAGWRRRKSRFLCLCWHSKFGGHPVTSTDVHSTESGPKSQTTKYGYLSFSCLRLSSQILHPVFVLKSWWKDTKFKEVFTLNTKKLSNAVFPGPGPGTPHLHLLQFFLMHLIQRTTHVYQVCAEVMKTFRCVRVKPTSWDA